MKSLYAGLVLLLFALSAQCQTDSIMLPPYQRFRTVPPFKLLKTDSTTYFTKDDLKKNKAVLIIIFSPDCEHCQHETEEILNRIDDFKDIQIVMATTLSFNQMKEFYEKYELSKYNNITVGLDFQYVLLSFFRPRHLPYLGMYDKKGKLLTTFEGSLKMEELLKIFE
jgi:thioredoxin-related protein